MSSLFANGFCKYLESKRYCDLTLRCEHTEFKVHRIILVHGSEFFSCLLLGTFKEKSQPVIELKYPDPYGVFPEVLRFMYGGQIHDTINNSNVIPLLAMSDHYLIKDLKQMCYQYVISNATRNNAFQMLEKAIEFQLQDLIDFYCNLIAKNFCYIKEVDFSVLNFSIFSSILHHPFLAVKAEFDLYNCICNYIERRRNSLDERNIYELLETIRFRWMTFEQLQHCERNDLVPRNLLLEAIMARLRQYEDLERNTMLEHESSGNRRLQRRISCTTFEYKFDFDDRGIVHYLCSRAEMTNNLKMPAITVTSSSIEMGNVQTLLQKTPADLWTKDVPASWFALDFGRNRAVAPTHYTLRHGGNYRADSLRTWDLQGSKDGKTWTLLRRHTHDMSLTDKFATHTWTIDPNTNTTSNLNTTSSTENISGSSNMDNGNVFGAIFTSSNSVHANEQRPSILQQQQQQQQQQQEQQLTDNSYRYFRILQTGRNSSNHNFLVLSGIEFYGDLYEWRDDEDS